MSAESNFQPGCQRPSISVASLPELTAPMQRCTIRTNGLKAGAGILQSPLPGSVSLGRHDLGGQSR